VQRYPDLNAMPTELVYELALSRAEAGNYDGAISLFKDRFFGREEGGTNVRQVWVEVKLAEAIGLGRTGHCREALVAMKNLRAPVTGVSFTENGMEAIAETARTNYLLGELAASCGDEAEAQRRYQAAAKSTELSQVVWAWAAARKLPGFESAQWQSRLTSALSQSESRLRTSSGKGSWAYSVGILRIALGHEEEGKASLREAILLPEGLMSHHFARLALDGTTPR
jgi:hypothetical protein